MQRIGLALLAAAQLTACASGESPKADAGSSGDRPASAPPAVTSTPATPASPATPPAPPSQPAAAAVAVQALAEPAEGQTLRVGGDKDARIEARDGNFYFDRCSITTPLPEGYPDPTPPGAIDLKRYPSVRRAEFSGSMTPDLGMNMAFFPLFNHIKDRRIAMTSPVEMNFTGVDRPSTETTPAARPEGWTMSFLYRRAEQGPTGVDPARERVRVVDAPAVTVVSMGVKGSQSWSRIRREARELERWLEEGGLPGWERAGEMRALYYNGPEKREADKWAEVQVPVRRVDPLPAGTSTR